MGCGWSFSTNLLVLTFCLLIYLAWQTEASKSIESMIDASKNKRIESLSCHVCHSETDMGCFNLTETPDDFGFGQPCDGEQLQCVVKKFAFTSTYGNGSTSKMRTFSIKRNCTKKCEDGCVVMGERTRLYVCSQCCKKSLCNIGSGSSSIYLVDNSKFQIFLTSVAHVPFFAGTLHHVWHGLEMLGLLFLQLLL